MASWAWSTSSGAVFWSRDLHRVLGLDPGEEQLSCEAMLRNVHPDDRRRLEQTFREAVGQASDFECEYRIVRSGDVRRLQNIAQPVFDRSGELRQYVGRVVDLGEQDHAAQAVRSLQAELARASRIMTMGQLAASIAHEVKQPLTAVIASGNAALRWLNRSPPGVDQAKEALQSIMRDAKRATDVVARIRALVSKASEREEMLNVDSVLQEVVAVVREELRTNGITLQLDLGGDLPPVAGDRVHLQQVLLNLIMNAIEAMADTPLGSCEVRIRTQMEARDYISVMVSDSGSGIMEEPLERVFDAYYSTKPQGMGIGLTISRSIVEAHGGRVWVTRNDGPGVTFQFTLPVAECVQRESTGGHRLRRR